MPHDHHEEGYFPPYAAPRYGSHSRVTTAGRHGPGTDRVGKIRRHPRHFAVLPGHVYPEVEFVVAETDAYVVVEKVGEAAAIVEGAAAVLAPQRADSGS